MNKKIVARELLILLISIWIGLTVVPFFLLRYLGGLNELRLFYAALIGQESGSILAWIIVLSPYIFIQLIRSIIWANK